jgi:putative sigma-54 modulation protein
MDATDALRNYAEEKVRHSERLVRDAIDAHVILSVEKRRHCAEITLQADHETFVASGETDDLYAAIDKAIAKLDRQLRKHTTKREARKHDPIEQEGT